jgi:predicted MFS family arabinose efflux permease
VTGLLLAAWVMAMLDRMIIVLLVPGIQASMGISDTEISLVHGTAFALFYAIAGLPLGRLVDQTNRRNLIIAGVVGWSLGTIACGLADNFIQLVAGRIVVGVCQAMLAPASLSTVADFCAPEKRGRVTAILVSGSTLARSRLQRARRRGSGLVLHASAVGITVTL